MPELRLTRRARDLMAGLGPELQDVVAAAILRLQSEPWAVGKPLQGRMRGTWVAKVGSYRILYTIEGTEAAVTIVVRAVLHRSAAYPRR